MIDLSRASRAAEQAAYAAGTHLQASRSRLIAAEVTQKSPADVVAEVDREAQALMREVITRQLPEHGLSAAPTTSTTAATPPTLTTAARSG